MRLASLVLPLGLACAVLAAPSPTFAQSDSATATIPDPSSAAVQLQVELNALDAMTDALGPMVGDAEKRLELMKVFIKEQNLDASSYKLAADQTGFTGLTFNQALQVAITNQGTRGTPTVTNQDANTLQAEVNASQTLVQSQWTRLNTLHTEVHRLSAFLHSQGKLDAYTDWASTDAAKRAVQQATDKPPMDQASSASGLTEAQREANIRKYQQHLVALRQQWDQAQYQYAADDGTNVVATSPLSNHVTNYNPTAAAYAANQANDYYGGTYWNGYSDPYYDVWGYPMVGRWPVVPGRGNWDRGWGRAPVVAPAADHPRMGGARR